MDLDDNAVRETHTSWVFLIGDKAYKVKKPVKTPFLDFSTMAKRRKACHAEVRVNRRLAPDVYLGVQPLHDAVGKVIDHFVVMRRMPDEGRLSTLVTAGGDVDDTLRDIARQIARLHLSGLRTARADAEATAAACLDRWRANDDELRPLTDLLADPARPGRVTSLAERYVLGREPLFVSRIKAGRAVDGHGDLLAHDIFVTEQGVRLLDALDFDDSLRMGDGLADIAFLAMDLERLGDPEAATRLLAFYAEFTADRWPATLAHHYIAYRAQVRAKVACIRARQQCGPRAPEADALLALAERHLLDGRVRLVLIGGGPASGKTTLASGLGLPVLNSDEVRKQLAGLEATTRAAEQLNAGIYGPAMTALTYGELLHRASVLLGQGESVVVDATWADPVWRHEAQRIAVRCGADMVGFRCVVPLGVAADRAGERLARGGDASDATPAVALALADRFAEWPEAVEVDTTREPALAVTAVRELLNRA